MYGLVYSNRVHVLPQASFSSKINFIPQIWDSRCATLLQNLEVGGGIIIDLCFYNSSFVTLRSDLCDKTFS